MKFFPMNHEVEWRKALTKAASGLGIENVDGMGRDDSQQVIVKALPEYLLMCFCESVRINDAKRWAQLEGVRAAHHYLIQKNHWAPQIVEALDVEQLCLALHRELLDLELSDEARAPFWGDVVHYQIKGLDLDSKRDRGHDA